MRIKILEYDPKQKESYESVLQEFGHTIVDEDDGPEKVDLLIVDPVNMAFVKAISRVVPLVIVATGKNKLRVLKETRNLTNVAVLTKPFYMVELLDLIEVCLDPRKIESKTTESCGTRF